METMTNYNETYSTRNKKFTFNIPNDLFEALEVKSKSAGYEEVAPYLRHVISHHTKEGVIHIDDIIKIIGEKENKRREYQVRYTETPTIKTNNTFVRINVKNFIDKVLHRQIYFKWK